MVKYVHLTADNIDAEIHVDIGWLWDGGIDVSIGSDEFSGDVKTVAEVLPWLQKAIAEHYPTSQYSVDSERGKPRSYVVTKPIAVG